MNFIGKALTIVLFFVHGSVLTQQYWPPQQWAYPQSGRWNGYQNNINNNYWTPRGYGSSRSGYETRNPYEGTIWRSGWIPARNLNQGAPANNINYPAYAANKHFKDYEVRSYVERYYPNVFNSERPYYSQTNRQPASSGNYNNYINARPPYSGENSVDQYYGQPQQPAYEDPSTFPEVIATCDRRHCYLSCRLGLLGGGRCTKAGCVCYMAFFDYDGSPTSNYYPEDNIWFELQEHEQDEIRQAMAEHKVHSAPATERPPYNPPKPTQRPTNRPPYNPPTARPPYNPPRPPLPKKTTTVKPKPGKGDRDFFGGGGGDDDDDDGDDDLDF